MKSKKKTKKAKRRVKVAPPSKRHKSAKDYSRKTLGQEVKEALEDVLKQEQATNKHAGGKFEDFMKLEQENFGLTTEKCACTPEKGCLDQPIEFKDHQVHNGLEWQEYERQMCAWKEQVIESQERKERSKSWYEYFTALFSFWPKDK